MYTKEEIRKVAVYCASSTKIDNAYFVAARKVGQIFAEAGMEVIYGAGNMGLMGEVAEGVLERKGRLTGVIPQFMIEQGWHHSGCTDLVVTKDMADRKTWIWQHADALVALPGGIGTLDELSEIIVLKQLGIVTQPIIMLNTNGYYDDLLRVFDRMIDERFMLDIHRRMIEVVHQPEEIIPAILRSERGSMEMRKRAKI